MPTIKRTVSLAAGAEATPLTGSQYEYLPFDASIEAAVLADAGASIEATMYSGTDVLLENTIIDQLAVATPIKYPEDYDITDVAAAGERLGIRLRETTGAGGPYVVRVVLRIMPL